MFEEFYEMYESEEQEVVALINRCIGGGYDWKGKFWEMTVVTLGIMFCDTGEVSTKEVRLDWPVTDEDRNGEKGWGRFRNEQICRLKIRRMKEEWAKSLVVHPWCISEVVKAHEDCPELQDVLDEYHNREMKGADRESFTVCTPLEVDPLADHLARDKYHSYQNDEIIEETVWLERLHKIMQGK